MTKRPFSRRAAAAKTQVEAPVEPQVEQVEPQVEAPVEPTPPTPHTVDVGVGIRSRSSFGKTFYYIDPKRVRATKGPNQLRGIIDWMLKHEVTSPENALQGSEIGTRAVADGYVVTEKLTGPVIFAYYIRRMEKDWGVEHAVTIHAKSGQPMA